MSRSAAAAAKAQVFFMASQAIAMLEANPDSDKCIDYKELFKFFSYILEGKGVVETCKKIVKEFGTSDESGTQTPAWLHAAGEVTFEGILTDDNAGPKEPQKFADIVAQDPLKPIAKPVAKPAEPKPDAKPAAKPAAKPVAEPVAEPKPAAKPAAEPKPDAAPEEEWQQVGEDIAGFFLEGSLIILDGKRIVAILEGAEKPEDVGGTTICRVVLHHGAKIQNLTVDKILSVKPMEVTGTVEEFTDPNGYNHCKIVIDQSSFADAKFVDRDVAETGVRHGHRVKCFLFQHIKSWQRDRLDVGVKLPHGPTISSFGDFKILE